MPKWRVPRKENGKIDFRPRKHHGFSFFIMLMGFLLPPLAVAVRFGIGKDFFINCICTICGYIPGHGHNFFIQNIRNNEHRNRTPKWARRYGLVDDYDSKRLQKKRAWVGRYNDQTSTRQMYDDAGNVYTYENGHRFEDGEGPARLRTRPTSNSQDGLDQYYESNGREGGHADNQSLRRSKSRTSLRSLGRRSEPDVDMLPGAGDAERRRGKGKSGRMIPMLTGGGRKGKADRHARSERVMHNSDYIQSNRSPYDQRSLEDSLADSNGSYGRRESFEGPENADDNIRKRMTQGLPNGHQVYDAHVLPAKPPQPAPVDIMSDNHQF